MKKHIATHYGHTFRNINNANITISGDIVHNTHHHTHHHTTITQTQTQTLPLTSRDITPLQTAFVTRLRSLTNPDRTPNAVPQTGDIRGILSGKWALSAAVVSQLYGNDGQFIRQNPEGQGVRDVGIATGVDEHGSLHSFHFKRAPEYPCYELAVNQLSLILFGETVFHDVLDLYVNGAWTLFLVSDTVPGTSMATQLEWGETNSDDQKRAVCESVESSIDPISFGKQCIMAMLCRLQDQKPDNIILAPTASPPYKKTLFSIDNERVFVGESTDIQTADIQSILFCMDRMRDPVDDELLDIIHSWKTTITVADTESIAGHLVQKWLSQLIKLNVEMETHFPKERRDEFSTEVQNRLPTPQRTYLGFEIQPGMIWKLLLGLTHVTRLLPGQNMFSLLERVLPNSSLAYRRVLSTADTLDKRFVQCTEFTLGSLASSLKTAEIAIKQVGFAEIGVGQELAWLRTPQPPVKLHDVIGSLERHFIDKSLEILNKSTLTTGDKMPQPVPRSMTVGVV